MFENVVVGIRDEGEFGRGAISLARQLISADGAVTFVNVNVVASRPAPDSGAHRDAEARGYVLARLTALAAEFAMTAQVACVDARSVRRGLHAFARQHGADLLVVSASHNDDLARIYLADDTSEVLEKAPCAVAVAPRGYEARIGDMRKIGVAYDGSPESARALELGRALAAERGGVLSAFEAVGTPMYVHDPWNVEGETEARVEAARQRISGLGDVKPEAASGDAGEELLRYADSVDLLVMGSHRYTPFDRLLDGSLSQRLADSSSSPLLVLAATSAGGERKLQA